MRGSKESKEMGERGKKMCKPKMKERKKGKRVERENTKGERKMKITPRFEKWILFIFILCSSRTEGWLWGTRRAHPLGLFYPSLTLILFPSFSFKFFWCGFISLIWLLFYCELFSHASMKIIYILNHIVWL